MRWNNHVIIMQQKEQKTSHPIEIEDGQHRKVDELLCILTYGVDMFILGAGNTL